uniref:phytanoyl-CoA dioxygenase family protein n=1 Tax=Algoriphagus sp. TaxID=1872435 RepID=UPI0040481AA4
MKINKDLFEENGFVVVRNVFSESEISELRKLVYQTLEEDIQSNRAIKIVSPNRSEKHKNVFYTVGDFLIKPLHSLLLDERILSIARTILGGQPAHFGESNYQVGVGDRGFHRDGVDRVFPIGSDWSEDYHIIRIGVYLQDHDKCSGGLKVQAGSHKNAKGKRILLDSRAGDVVVWDLRTFHSGNSVRLTIAPNLPLGCRIENRLPSWLIIEEEQERIGCFMVFGLDNKHLHRHIEKHYKVKFHDYIKIQKYSPEIIQKSKDAGLDIIIPEL